MTHKPIQVLPDGTHKYASYHTYTPVPDEERTYGRNKPEDPRAVRFHGQWFLPIDSLPDDQRVMPARTWEDEAPPHRKNCGCRSCSQKRAWARRKAATP